MLHGEYGIDDVCLSIPVTVGIHGAGGRVPIPLEDAERQALVNSAETLKTCLRSLDL
jgi:L-lactate dehydrogenase